MMPEVTSGLKRVDKWDDKKREYLRAVAARGVTLSLDGRRGARWATGPRGVVAILGASEAPGGDRWFLGLNEAQFRRRNAIGVILLCERRDRTLDFALPADRLESLLDRLSHVGGERKINLVRNRDRYIIQIPGSEGSDVTETLGSLDWLGASSRPPTDPVPAAAATRSGERLPGHRFFAKFRRGRLEPLDPVDLREGEVVLVRTEPVRAAPRHASLRRILALGGASNLPADLAAQHDHYAHGRTPE